MIDLTSWLCPQLTKTLDTILQSIIKLTSTIMSQADEIRALKDPLNKSTGEINAKIDALEATLAENGDVETAIAELRDAVNANDAIVPDPEQPA